MSDDILKFKEIPKGITFEEGQELTVQIQDNNYIVCKILKLEKTFEAKPKRQPRTMEELQDFIASQKWFPDSEEEVVKYIRENRG